MLIKNKKAVEYSVNCLNGGYNMVDLYEKIDKKEQKCYNNRHNLRGRL
jgi:hypothetical protein